MIQDLANYDRLYEESCIKFVLEGKGTVDDFCRKLNLSQEHYKCFKLAVDKLIKDKK